jgi:predicted ATPase
MIKSIQYIDGFPVDLPFVGKRLYSFNDGINLLFGPNGCGKSTILKTLKGYCAIQTGGWTHPSIPNEIGIGRLGGADYPHCYSSYTPAKCKATVIWDGTPTIYNDGECSLNKLSYFYNFKKDFDDGITEQSDVIEMLEKTPSSGQYRASKLNKVLNLIKSGPPEYTEKDFGHFPVKDDKMYSLREFKFWKYINALYIQNFGQGKNTVLLDEPERSLSHKKQKELFLKVIPEELNGYQVIIATHSLYALFTPNANIIEMEDGYVEGLTTAIKEIGEFLGKNTQQNVQLEFKL